MSISPNAAAYAAKLDAELLVDQRRAGVIYRAIRNAACSGAPCPSDWSLAQLVGAQGPSAVSNVVHKLASRGALRIKPVGGNARVIEVLAIASATAPSADTRRDPSMPSENQQRAARAAAPSADTRRDPSMPSENQQRAARAAALAAERKPPSPAPDRTPCFKCGTRADIGCRHRRML